MEHRFTEQEQREIIQVAAQLQRSDGDSLTRDQLKMAAAEAGIEPRFVDEAIQRRLATTPSETDERARYPSAAIAILSVAQLAGLTIVLHGGSMWEYGGIHWACLMLLAFAWGSVSGGTVVRFIRSWVALAAGTCALALVAGLAVRLLLGSVHSNWLDYLRNIFLAESAMLLLGSVFTALLGRRAPTPTEPQALDS